MGSSTENLINMVQLYPILYDRRNSDYKNTHKKDLAWQQIANDLNEDPEAMKNRWKNLKDGYTKYRKSIAQKNNKKKKGRVAYTNWVWGPYMYFLEETFQSPPVEESNEDTIDVKKERKSLDTRSRSPSRCPSLEAPRSGSQSPVPIEDLIEVSMSPGSVLRPEKRRKGEHDNIERLLMHLGHEQRRDSIDLLFASYAQDLKKMRPNVQAVLKLKIAQLFAEAEMEELNKNESGS